MHVIVQDHVMTRDPCYQTQGDMTRVWVRCSQDQGTDRVIILVFVV